MELDAERAMSDDSAPSDEEPSSCSEIEMELPIEGFCTPQRAFYRHQHQKNSVGDDQDPGRIQSQYQILSLKIFDTLHNSEHQ